MTYARGRENLHIPLVLFNEALFPLLEEANSALDLGSIRGSLAPQPGQDVDEGRRVDAFTSASRETLRLAREQPIVMCLDDLHWADDATLQLLTYVTSRLEARRLAVLCCWRDDELGYDHRWRETVQAARRDGTATVVVLDGAAIGDGAIVAPNSVVSTRLPANTIAQGNPARVIFTRR